MTEGDDRIRIVGFDDPLPDEVDRHALLGGKGAGLITMTQLGLPVPPGFVITTNVCRQYLNTGWPSELDAEIEYQLALLANRLQLGWGDPSAPLIVSVRSGAPISMPGMMDTLLNIGLTPAARETLAAQSGDQRFAADTWLRFCRTYATTVLEFDARTVNALTQSDGSPGGLLAAADCLISHADKQGKPIPQTVSEQLHGAIETIFRSWNSPRAKIFRDHEGIPNDLATAVTVQSMVFGNLGDRSGSGVIFTRDPTTGEARPFGDYLARAQGEDVVAGTHAVHSLDALRDQLPAVHTHLLRALAQLETHYRDMCEVEFTISDAQLFLLQTRIGRRSPLAAVRIAVAMAEHTEFPLTRAEAVARIGQDELHKLATAGRVNPGAQVLATGLAASPGIGVGILCTNPDRAAELNTQDHAVVLARNETSPADVHGIVGAAALVTTHGGVASHAAVVARSWAIPTVTSLEGAKVVDGALQVGDTQIAEGETITVDGGTGTIYLGNQREATAIDVPEARLIREWGVELGLEPGQSLQERHRRTIAADISLLQLVRFVQLKGLCRVERASHGLNAPPDTLDTLIEANPNLFNDTDRGLMVAPAGRAWLLEQMEQERAGVDAGAVLALYRRFDELNGIFKDGISGWQTSPDPEAARPTLVNTITAIHANLIPLIGEVADQLPRLRSFADHFENALGAIRNGDDSMIASPLKDSYHTSWFELHEELIALANLDRATEEMNRPST